MKHHVLLAASLAFLASCGSSSSSSSGGGGGSAGSDAVNADRLANLNAYRASTGGTSLVAATTHAALVTSATRHAGYQAIAGAISHDEPNTGNALYTHTSLGNRIRSANGGTDLPSMNGGYYWEDVATNYGSGAVDLWWNSVYHRIPMMRHAAIRVGYGDADLARQVYPSAGVPLSNGYATSNWAENGAISVTFSYWPSSGLGGVPRIFNSNNESPDPVPSQNQVGPPLHLILPTASDVTAISASMSSSGGSVNLRALVHAASTPTVGGDIAEVATDNSYLDPGEIFLIPLSTLDSSTTYTWSATVTLQGQLPAVYGPYTFSTTP